VPRRFLRSFVIRPPLAERRHPSQGAIVAFLISVALAFGLGVGCMYAYSTYTSEEADLEARIVRLNGDLLEAKQLVETCEGLNGRITNVIISIGAIRSQVDSAVEQLRDGVDPETLLPGLSASEQAYTDATAELMAIQECNIDAVTGE
jgi:hypothetical protein